MTTRRRRRALAILSVALSFAVTLLALEAGLRIASGAPFSAPDPGGGIAVVGDYPASHDATLGYVPTPGASGDALWGESVTITRDGVRSNGAAPPRGVPLLAVGDSYTFGDEVSDHETWPARLESRLGRPVVNGGVFGYGLDQIVLRAERLLPEHGADTLIVSLTPDDVRRCEYAYRYAWKPWFEVEDGALVLRGVPVPAPGAPPPGEGRLRRLLRRSHLVDLVMRRLDPSGWTLPDSLRVHRQGIRVARLLVDRLAAEAEARGHRLLLVVQWHPRAEGALVAPLLRRASELGVAAMTTEPRLRREIAAHPVGPEAFFRIGGRGGRLVIGHMTPRGNEIVAQAVAERLATLP